MPRLTYAAPAVACFLPLAWAAPAAGYIAVPLEPIPNRVALANCVVVGRITAVAADPVTARLYPFQSAKVDFTVAEVQVSETVCGARGTKRVRLGFIGFSLKSGQYKPAPAVGREGCFYAVKHWTKDFYVVPVGGFLDGKGADFDKNLALTRRCGRLLERPEPGLTSKDAGDRALAAYLLVLRYTYAPLRWYGRDTKLEPIDAGQSKLILLSLAEADWDRPDPQTKASPAWAIGWLHMTASVAGSPLPETFPRGNASDPKYTAAVRKWLHDHAATYRIQKLVPARAVGMK
jgi:hypothetical protein